MICPICGAMNHETIKIMDFVVLICPKATNYPPITIISVEHIEELRKALTVGTESPNE